jgi:uncharacterized protein YndB with AHSA1/START domain
MPETTITAEPGIPQITIVRDFQAPRDLVFRAYTEPDLLVQWLGPRELTMKVDRWDARAGGSWRYIHTDPQGQDYGFHGVFHNAPTPAVIVQTFEFEGAPGHVCLETTTMTQTGGTTEVRTVSVFQSVEDRDAMIAADMEHGVRDSADRLTELLAGLRDGGSGSPR